MSTNAGAAEEALDRHALEIAEALKRSATSRSNQTELREDVHALIVTASEELYGLGALTSRASSARARAPRPTSARMAA